MTAFVWLFVRLFTLMIISWREISSLQLLITPEVVIKGLNFSLECSANDISANINIRNPSGKVVTCRPTGEYLNASCTDTAYVIDEEAATVSMTKEAANVDQGDWICTHTTSTPESLTESITVEILQPLPNGHLIKNTTAEPSETINTNTGDTFTAIYGCFSSTVKFKWTIDTVNWIVVGKKSTVMACAAGTTSYMDTQTVSEIFNHLKTDVDGMLSVTILSTDDHEFHPMSSFNQVFVKGENSESSKKLSTGEVAGIAVGSVGVVGCVVGIVVAYKTLIGSKAKGLKS